MNVSVFNHERKKKGIKLDPRTKMLMLILINIVIVSGNIRGPEYYARIVLALVPLILLMQEHKWKSALVYMIAFGTASFGEGFVVQNTSGALNLVCLIFSGLISRFMPVMIMGYYLVSTTTVSEFIAGMERMHVSEKITIPLSVMFRYFPTIAEENHAIGTAMKMRGIGFLESTKNPITLLEYKLVPIMMSTVRIGDELSAASLTKGLGNQIKRTNMCEIGFSAYDVVLMLIVLLSFGVFLFY
ncbi:MAG: energy-coupling factor transporter transmembrane component T [Lachnospiraceae bacterium]|nr:energy-coupling factor transporter transmembrane component T [Lachnospiraceae bacterium]